VNLKKKIIMPHKEFLIQKCTMYAIGWLAYSNIILSPSFIGITIQAIIGVFVVSAMMTNMSNSVRERHDNNWSLWFKATYLDSFSFWGKSIWKGIKNLFGRNK